jgi:hypothetical protein
MEDRGMRTIGLVTAAVLLATIVAATAMAFAPPERQAQGEPEARRLLDRDPPSATAEQRWGVFVAENQGAWEAVWNRVTGTPHRIRGRGVKIALKVTRANAGRLVEDFITARADLLGVNTGDLRLLSNEKHGARWYADYQQTYQGLDVIGGRVHVRLKEDGVVTTFGADFYQDISLSTSPVLAGSGAEAQAKRDVGFDPTTDEVLSARLVVLPVERGETAIYHLAYELRLRVERGPAIWRTYVDADTGEILKKSNEIYYDAIYGTVTGNVKPLYITDPDQEEAFTDQYVAVTAFGEDTTDATGAYSIEVGTGNRSLTAELSGDWAAVTNSNGPEAWFGVSVPAGTQVDILWDDPNSLPSERNAYYHTVVAHSKIKDIDPSFTGMDRMTPVRVNRQDYCNAYWDGIGMTFGAGSGSCQDLAMFSDVIYHEYGHGITDFLYRPLAPTGAMHEAFSDYFACTITGEPEIGEGILGPGTRFRTIDNTLRYPEDLTGEVHDDGRILAAALWDLRAALHPDVRLADSLFHYARYGKSDNFFDYYYDVLETDDDDGDLTNGTPHFYEIVEAFGAHGIGPGLSMAIAHQPICDCEDSLATHSATAVITGNLTVDPDSVILYYSDGGQYMPLPMLPTGNPDEYSATVPAYPCGTEVDYYIYARALGRPEVECDPAGAPADVHSFFIGDDTEAPVIAHTALEDQPDAGWPAVVTADVSDNLGVASVILEYSKNGTPQTPVTMTPVAGTATYQAAFDVAASSGDYFEYRIVATDASAGSHATAEPPVGMNLFGILEAHYYTFETGEEGWTHHAPGTWNDEWHLSTTRNHTTGGSQAWKCGSTGSGDYGTHQKALLESPLLDLGENARMVIWHWIDMETYEPVQGSGIAWDGAGVTLMDSTGSGTPVEPVGGYPYRMMPGSAAPFLDNAPVFSGQNDWTAYLFDLSFYTGQCQVRLKFGSDDYIGAEGWYVDDIMIWSGDARAGTGCDPACDLDEDIPVAFSLRGAAPNPTNRGTRISYAVPQPGAHVSISVYDVHGRLAKVLVNENKIPGRYTVGWDGRNTYGKSVSPGIYFVRMESKQFRAASKVILLR